VLRSRALASRTKETRIALRAMLAGPERGRRSMKTLRDIQLKGGVGKTEDDAAACDLAHEADGRVGCPACALWTSTRGRRRRFFFRIVRSLKGGAGKLIDKGKLARATSGPRPPGPAHVVRRLLDAPAQLELPPDDASPSTSRLAGPSSAPRRRLRRVALIECPAAGSRASEGVFARRHALSYRRSRVGDDAVRSGTLDQL